MMSTVRDRLWLWAHPAGSHTGPDLPWGLPGESTIQPAEAAGFLGLANVLMVRYDRNPDSPLLDEAPALRRMDRLIWSVEGGGGADVEAALALRETLPNLRGLMLDDYFERVPKDAGQADDEHPFSLAALRRLRAKLDAGDPPLELWGVLYNHELDRPQLADHLALFDVVTFWIWQAATLAELPATFDRFARLVDAGETKRKVLGIYLWDYGTGRPMPLDALAATCDTGLRWLHEGRVEGLIFLASCLVDLELDTVAWTRQWIAEHGPERLAG